MWSNGGVDGDPPEPIEVELTAHAPRAGRGRRRDLSPPPAPLPDDGAPSDPPAGTAGSPAVRGDRTRLAVVASAAGVLALVLGWMLGRATTGGPDTAGEEAAGSRRATTTTTVDAPTATLPLVGEEIDGADFEPPASPPVRVGPTTTEPIAPSTEPIAVDPRLADVAVRLVGVELDGTLVEVDVEAATFTSYSGTQILADGSPFIVGPDWVVGGWNGQNRLVRSDGTAVTVSLGDPWTLLHVPGTDLFWRTAYGIGGPNGTLDLVDLTGERVGPSIDLPPNTWPFVVDPASGGVVVSAAGRYYVVTPDTVEQLATGEIVGMSAEIIVSYDCDAALVCALHRIDRADGGSAPIPSDPDVDPAYTWQTIVGWGGGRTAAVSPDGRWVSVVGSSWSSSVVGIIELASGRFVQLAPLASPPVVVWSPDGRFAFTLDGQRVMAYDTDTGETFPAFTGVASWMQLGVRPPDPPRDRAAPSGATLLSVSAEEAVEG